MGEIAATFPLYLERYPGIQLKFGGQKLETAKSFGSLKQSFAIAIVLIYVILAGLFRSYHTTRHRAQRHPVRVDRRGRLDTF